MIGSSEIYKIISMPSLSKAFLLRRKMVRRGGKMWAAAALSSRDRGSGEEGIIWNSLGSFPIRKTVKRTPETAESENRKITTNF
jgi:hypothetical protein